MGCESLYYLQNRLQFGIIMLLSITLSQIINQIVV